MNINEQTKNKLFEQVLKLEKLADSQTYDGRDYLEQSNGAFLMLQILGISSEYISWSYGK